jgi:CheY-like chemotaxis protein/HPt (histidine-containing phosphotransfer) domain-containing protein
MNPMDILVVEDNLLNQKMIRTYLTRLGHSVSIANNGEEAVITAEKGRYDLIFMDVQMPIMDGLEASRKIRSLSSPAAQTPIVAMTAYALQGDSQRCLDAGMDDYIPKPIDTRKLVQVLQKWSKRNGSFPNEPYNKLLENTVLVDPNAILDVKSALPRFSQDIDFYQSMLSEFADTLPERLCDLKQALEDRQWKILGDQAHNLKGVAANFGVMRISTLARQIDEASREQQIESVQQLIQKIENAIVDLDRARAEIGD